MEMKKILSIAVVSLMLGLSSMHTAGKSFSTAKAFADAFCKSLLAEQLDEKIFIVSTDIFKDKTRTFSCSNGSAYKIEKRELKEEPGHFLFEVDPIKDSDAIYDCDAKADFGMRYIGLNCYPMIEEVQEPDTTGKQKTDTKPAQPKP
jgi:hypothetical protein